MGCVSSQAPVDVIRDMYAAFEAVDVEAALALLDDAIVIEQDPALPWGGRFEGKSGALDFFAGLVGTIDSKVTQLALYGAADQVVQYGRTVGTVKATGTPFDVAECHVWTVRDGLAVHASFIIDSAAMLAALNAPASD